MNFQEWVAAVTASSAAGSAFVMFVLSTIKWAKPSLVAGNETRAALLIGIVSGVASGVAAHGKSGVFPAGWLGWAAAVAAGVVVGFTSGIGSQILHDKGLNPAFSKDVTKESPGETDGKGDKPAPPAAGA